MRSKAFFINGGAGRVICSIPAFEKYAETHDDFIIVCEGGTDFFKGHPTLHNKAYDNWHKGLFQDFIKDRDCVSPEPYRNWHYYNQKCSLSQAFDIIINDLKEPRELPDPKIVLNKMELLSGFNAVDEVKAGTGKDKILVVQPFGRSVEQVGKDFIADPSSRSFPLNAIVQIINQLKKDYGVIIMSEIQFPLEENEEKAKHKVARPQISDMRLWSSIINAADHFLGCDSMGQHIAKAFDKTATVVTGSTYPINITYPDSKDFDIIDVGQDKRKYSPIRISMDDEIDRYNDEAMEMTDSQIKEVIDSVKKRMGKSVAYTGTMVLNSNEQTTCCPPSTSSSNQNQSITPKLIPSSDKKGFGGSNSIEKEIKKLLNN
jgi:ADP-heptose:LPS heptosyltransferase